MKTPRLGRFCFGGVEIYKRKFESFNFLKRSV